MAEWLILLLLVPAIVVPVVLLVGFAGCNWAFGVKDTHPLDYPPAITGFQPSGTSLKVFWFYQYPERVLRYEIERTNPDGTSPNPPYFQASASPFEDPGLQRATSYTYRVRAVWKDDVPRDWSKPDSGKTLALDFEPTFTQTLTSNGVNWQGYTLVQRIEHGRLFRSGTQVLIALHASSTREAQIDRIYISRAAGPDYQPAGDLTAVYDNPASPLVVPKNMADIPPAVVGPVNYNLDPLQALLIAFEFHGTPMTGPESDVGYADVPMGDASAYYIQGSEANPPLGMRSTGYTPAGSRVYLIERIEVEVA
jgi:hypothetical protein